MTFIEELNDCVEQVIPYAPRVRFEADLSDSAHKWIRKKHANGMVHEPGTLGALTAVSRRYPGCKTIFDIGALFGYFALFCAVSFDDSDVTAFDMHPASIKDLNRNCPGIKKVHAVLSDEIKPRHVFWVSAFNIYEEPAGGWKDIASVPGAMKHQGRGLVRCDVTTLDDYCARNTPPDLMKIDVEGFQAKCIKGGLNMIAEHKPIIVIELHDPEKLARFDTTNAKTVQPLFDLGYQGYWCGNFRDRDATFEAVDEMTEKHERLSIMVLHA